MQCPNIDFSNSWSCGKTFIREIGCGLRLVGFYSRSLACIQKATLTDLCKFEDSAIVVQTRLPPQAYPFPSSAVLVRVVGVRISQPNFCAFATKTRKHKDEQDCTVSSAL